jgi:GT2 family glycosyltransferase
MKISQSYNYFRWADQFDSGNALVKRTVFSAVGLFDEQFNKQRMGDGEFGIRAYLNGYRSISNPYASRVHLKVPAGGLREMGSWDGFRPKKWFAPKPIPSVVYLYKKYYPKQLYRSVILLGIILSNVSYKNKGSKKMLALSVVLAVIKAPLLYFQFLKSNGIAKAMLRTGDKIEYLNS